MKSGQARICTVEAREREASLFVLLLFTACGPALHPLPTNPIKEPEELLSVFWRKSRVFEVVYAEARMEHYGPKGVAKGRVTLLIDPTEGKIRADAWTPTDQHVAVLTADSDKVFYFERGAPQCIVSPPCPEVLARMLPLGVGVKEVGQLLLGVPPVYADAGRWKMGFDRTVGAYLLESEMKGGGTQRLWIREDGVAVRAEMIALGTSHYRIFFSHFEEHHGRALPMHIKVELPLKGEALYVLYRKVEIGQSAAEEDFDVACPEGLPVKVETCEEGGRF